MNFQNEFFVDSLEWYKNGLYQWGKLSVKKFLDIDVEGTNRRCRKTSLQPQGNLLRLVFGLILHSLGSHTFFAVASIDVHIKKTILSEEYKRRQSKKFSRSDPLHARWYQTDQMRRISQTSINQNETRTSFSRSLENNRLKSITQTPRNTRTSRNEQNETILKEQMNLIAEKLTKKVNEEN